MANYIQTLKESRTANMNFPCIFDETNIGSVFGMLDPTKKGFITFAQYKEGKQLPVIGQLKYLLCICTLCMSF